MASALTSSRPSFKGLNLTGRGHEEDPDVPGDVADDQRGQPAVASVEPTPEEAGGGGGPGQGQVLGHQVNGAVARGGDQHPRQAAERALQVLLDQAPPEEFFARPDDQCQRCRDGGSGGGCSESIDPRNFTSAGRHDPPGHRIAQPKDCVQRGGRAEAYRDVTPARSFPTQRRLAQQGIATEAAHAEGHPQPELRTRTAEGSGPDGRRQGEPAQNPPQRSPDPATRPTSSNTPKALCSRAVIRSIIAIARR